MMNNVKTFILLAALTALLLLIGHALGGQTGVLIALVMAVGMNFSAYWYSDQMVLKMFNARPVDASHRIYQIVATLARNANLPMPKVYEVDSPTPNAFATGRNPSHAAVAVTTGLMQRMDDEEISGVLGHEMAHVLHRDTLISAIAATFTGAISYVANIFMMSGRSGGEGNRSNPISALLMLFLAPMAAGLIQMAVSRSREFEADAGGAAICGHPMWLARALAKLEDANHQGQFPQADQHPNTAHMFTVNPLSGSSLSAMFRTHPLTAERIKRLQELAQATGRLN